jgi:hypothetical protein
MKDIFCDIEFQEIEIGRFRFKTPFRYSDYSLMGAAFHAPVNTVKKVLPSDRLKLVEAAPDTTTIAFIKYSTEYPSACWRDESGSPTGETKVFALGGHILV